MKVKIKNARFQSIWLDETDKKIVRFINQLLLPFEFRIDSLRSSEDVVEAIRDMKVRGAPLIGATAAFGVYLACLEVADRLGTQEAGRGLDFVRERAEAIRATRPTAVNLSWAVDRVLKILEGKSPDTMARFALEEALRITDNEKKSCLEIGRHGVPLIKDIFEKKKGGTVNILTHCNAGWLACIDYGTATAPIYMSHDMGIPVHVWVDETRPRNQGARLTAWELGQHGVPHTVITDNAGGQLMQQGEVDMVLVGSDRTTRRGDVANKIGTYLKALAARDNEIPFYVALPSSSIDFSISDGLKEIPIEDRGEEEVKFMEGILPGGSRPVSGRVLIMPSDSRVANPGFDITPARLVTGLITEMGVCGASEEEIIKLFPERD